MSDKMSNRDSYWSTHYEKRHISRMKGRNGTSRLEMLMRYRNAWIARDNKEGLNEDLIIGHLTREIEKEEKKGESKA